MIARVILGNEHEAAKAGRFRVKAGRPDYPLAKHTEHLLGVGRAALYPALVPPFALVVGALTLGELPSLWQLTGLAIVLIGFRLTQKD